MNEYLELLQDLIRCRAVTANIPAVNRASGILRQFLAAHGLACKVETDDAGRNILYAAPKGLNEPDYLLNAHLDVVPAPEGLFSPVIREGSIFGRGTADCQGCAAALARALILAGNSGRAGAFFSMDEETGGTTTAEMVKRRYVPRKLVIIVDADPWVIACAQKGIINAKLIAHGRGGHASEPWASENALDRLIAGYVRIRDAWPAMAPEIWGDTMAPTVLHAGTAENQIPGRAEMVLNIRFTEPGAEEKILSGLREISGLEVEATHISRPVSCNPDHPEIRQLKNAMQQAFGREIGLKKMCGATDARHFPDSVPVAVLGIEGHGVHSDSEFASIESIRLYSDMLSGFICGKNHALS